MAILRSLIHMLFMVVTVVPWALTVLIAAPFMTSTQIYWLCVGWLKLAVGSGRWMLGIRNDVIGRGVK